METKSSLLFSQQPAISPCPEADESSPHPSILIFNLHLNTVLKSMSQTLTSGLFPCRSSYQNPIFLFLSKLTTCPINLNLLDLNDPNRIRQRVQITRLLFTHVLEGGTNNFQNNKHLWYSTSFSQAM